MRRADLAFLAGNIFIQTNLGTEVFDYKNNIEVSWCRSKL